MLLSCGDALIDFVPAKTADGRDAYVPAVGGSCLNVATAMARLGARTGFVGGISTDLFGEAIAEHLTASQVSLEFTTRPDLETTCAFVKMIGNDAHYAFYDEGTASRTWTYQNGSIPFATIEALHIGSTTLINDPSASAYEALVADARAQVIISFDPNVRPTLTKDIATYRARMNRLAAMADIVRMSDEDFSYLYEHHDYDSAAANWLNTGASLVLITRGGDGVLAYSKAGKTQAPAVKVKLVDTIGAGDTFQGGMLVALSEAGLLKKDRLAAITLEQMDAALAFATKAASITVSRAGANPPWRSEM